MKKRNGHGVRKSNLNIYVGTASLLAFISSGKALGVQASTSFVFEAMPARVQVWEAVVSGAEGERLGVEGLGGTGRGKAEQGVDQ